MARLAALPAGSATGHTMDDQAETVFVNLLRGAGLDGMAGMRAGPTHPLLGIRRAQTHALCHALGLDPVHDPTNTDRRFVRNRVRHELLPLASAIAGRDLVPVLARQATLLADEADLLDELAAGIDAADAAAWRSVPEPLARRATRRWLRGPSPHPDLAAVERVLAVARGQLRATDVAPGVRVRRVTGHCRGRRSTRRRPVVSAPDDRGTRHGHTGATVTIDRWRDDPDLGQVVVAEDVLHKRVAGAGRRAHGRLHGPPPAARRGIEGCLRLHERPGACHALPGRGRRHGGRVVRVGHHHERRGPDREGPRLRPHRSPRAGGRGHRRQRAHPSYLRRSLLARRPASLEVSALLVKEGRQRAKLDLRYIGFHIPPDFVVGYGLDVAERYRNVPDIRVYQGPVPVTEGLLR